MKVRAAWVVVAVAAACGGKAVVDAPVGSGGAGGTTNATTNTTGEGAPLTCADLEAAYLAALNKAMNCSPNPMADSCSALVPSDLKQCCTQQVAVNAEDAESIAVLKEITQQYAELNCVMACGQDCPPTLPVSGQCNALSGKCMTVQPTPG